MMIQQNDISGKEQKNEMHMENVVFSKVIPAGRRIYYLDVRQTRKGDMFLTLTESKKIIEDPESNVFRFEKQKLFLYQEDFNKFMEGLDEIISFIRKKERDKYTS